MLNQMAATRCRSFGFIEGRSSDGSAPQAATFVTAIETAGSTFSGSCGTNPRKYVPPAIAKRSTAMAASAPPFPIEETTIAALHAAYVSGEATAVSVCRAHLDRIAAL